MAYSTGTATGLSDLLAIIRIFALANGWADTYYNAGDSWITKGSGDNGNDEIYTNIKLHFDPAQSIWNFDLTGAMGFRAGATSLQGGMLPIGPYYVALWDSPMQYWLTINGRRISFVIKVGSKYAVGYLGLLRPLATSEQSPYPMFVGGTHNQRHPWTTTDNSSFLANSDFSGGLTPSGIKGANSTYPVSNLYWKMTSYPWKLGPYSELEGATLDGKFIIHPGYMTYYEQSWFTEVALWNDWQQVLGQLDGIYFITGYNQSPENIIQVGADNYMVFPSFGDTEFDSWFAFLLD